MGTIVKTLEYARADEIRTQLLSKGVQIYDTKAGVEWRWMEQ